MEEISIALAFKLYIPDGAVTLEEMDGERGGEDADIDAVRVGVEIVFCDGKEVVQKDLVIHDILEHGLQGVLYLFDPLRVR